MDLAHKLLSNEIILTYGRVLTSKNNELIIESDLGILKTKKAASCLIEPQKGDLVLISRDAFGCNYLLYVLEKENSSHTVISLEGKCKINIKKGDLDISSEKISLNSIFFDLKTMIGKITFGNISCIGQNFEGYFKKVKTIISTFDSIIGRFIQKVKTCYRFVEKLEQLKAGRLRYLVQNSILMKGEKSVLKAEKKLKIDAKKIHLG